VIDSPLPRPSLRRSRFLSELAETLVLVLLLYTLVNLATERFYVEGPSMEPSFVTGQFVLVSRLNYLFGEPRRGDIVVFNSPEYVDQPDHPPLIKRLIGLPGEHIEIRQGQVYVDGALLDQPYINNPQTPFLRNDGDWQLGPDEFFVLGDNRAHSEDSGEFGAVSRERLSGRALVRYWPPSDWAILENYRMPAQ